jgi:hypothetical protein
MPNRRHHIHERLRETFIVEGDRTQTRGRIVAGAMIYVPALIAAVSGLVVYFTLT